MKLFNDKGEIPAGVRMLLENLLTSVAPEMAADVDVIATFVRGLDARLRRIETALNLGAIDNDRHDADREHDGQSSVIGGTAVRQIGGPISRP